MATQIRFTPQRSGTAATDGQRLASIDPRLSRTHYFDGQLLKASDLNRDQVYLDERLLELGQAIGSGIVSGLTLTLEADRRLRVAPGIAVAASGRVLELSDTALVIDLQDSGRLVTLNDGRLRRLPRGLHAVVLTRAEVIDGVAEAYPQDLAAPRRARVAAFAEGVEVRLMPLALPLPGQDGLAVRAALARELLGGGERLALPDDEAVALGLLAVDQGRVLWLDHGLLRRPQRPRHAPDTLQHDLAVHYRELLPLVLARRASQGLRGAWAARQHFQVLPPAGPLPRDVVDPAAGTQSFFPKDFEVGIAPIRRSEVATVLAESMRLAPIDLERDADCDVMVLVAMDDATFAQRARQLESPASITPPLRGQLARLDVFALRLRPLPPAHRIDTDAAAWRAIWNEATDADVLFVRRPPRTAETGLGAIVLAAGSVLPPPDTALPVDTGRLARERDEAEARADTAEQAQLRLQADNARQAITIEEQRRALALGGDARLADALAEVERLKTALAAAQQEIEGLRSDGRRDAVIANALEATSLQIDALKADLAAARRRIEQLETAGPVLDDAVKQRFDALALQVQQARDRADAATAQATALQQQLTEQTLQLAGVQRQLAQTQASLDDSTRQLTDTRTDLGTAQQALATLTDDHATLRSQLDSRTSELAEAVKARDESQRSENQAIVELLEARRQLGELSTANTRLNTDLAATLARLAEAQQTITTLRAEAARRLDLPRALTLLAIARARTTDEAALKSADQSDRLIATQDDARIAAVQFALKADRRFDPALWPTVLALVRNKPEALVEFVDKLQGSSPTNIDLPGFVLELGPSFGVPDEVLTLWKRLAG